MKQEHSFLIPIGRKLIGISFIFGHHKSLFVDKTGLHIYLRWYFDYHICRKGVKQFLWRKKLQPMLNVCRKSKRIKKVASI